jgi:peptide/nickel transport system permease protein
MVRFFSQRLLFIIVVSTFIVFFIHLGMRMASNSEVAEPNYDLVAFSKLAWQDTRSYLKLASRGDFGTFETVSGTMPVREILRSAYLNSMGLLLVALVISALIGLWLGILATLSKRPSWALMLLTLTLLGISTPSFFAGLLLQQGAIRFQAEFGRRLVSVAGLGWDYEHMLLPVLVLSARPLAYLSRSTYISLGNIMQQDYIRTAFAKGLRRSAIISVHALKNIAVPVLTAVGVSLRFSLSTLPVVEFFFGWPGMGLQLLEAINNRETAVVVTLALALGLTFLLVNFLLDILYRLIDPRIRAHT